ncbi:hypothetical protein [Kitasatospora purpeofusca]|uniref:hypothetical protein n=1 Tax=Kitasatospora purpeofusca TaxID=67352 RepID=UPI0036BD98FB
MNEYRNANFLPTMEATASVLNFSVEGRPSIAYRPVIGWLSDPVLTYAEKTGGHSIPYAIPLVLTDSGVARGMAPAEVSPKENGDGIHAPAREFLLGVSPNRAEAQRTYGVVPDTVNQLAAEIAEEQEAAEAEAREVAENAARAERQTAERAAEMAAQKVAQRADVIGNADALIAESREFIASHVSNTTTENTLA